MQNIGIINALYMRTPSQPHRPTSNVIYIIYDVCPGYASNAGKSGGMCPIDTEV